MVQCSAPGPALNRSSLAPTNQSQGIWWLTCAHIHMTHFQLLQATVKCWYFLQPCTANDSALHQLKYWLPMDWQCIFSLVPNFAGHHHRHSQGVQVHPLTTPVAAKKNFLGIFLEWGKNGAEFGEVHPRRWDKQVVGGSIWRKWPYKRGWWLKKEESAPPQRKSWLHLWTSLIYSIS